MPGPLATCFTVSGTVTGLASANLRLENRDTSDVLTIANDGPFTFSVPVQNGHPYTVIVHTAPTDPPQICRVQNFSGAIAGADVTDLVVTCGDCGNEAIDSGEQCDDGNLINGDGCSSICKNEACTPGRDRDGDRLDDCSETNTGEFLGIHNTGTDPDNRDTDGDGIDDGDETLGTTSGLDLPALGASPVHKDIFLEIDWFDDDEGCGQHSHQFTAGGAAVAIELFARAPVDNPDRQLGINLHIDYGQDVGGDGLFVGGNKIGDQDAITVLPPSAFVHETKLANLDPKRKPYFHYGLSVHSTDLGNGGGGEQRGNDLIVSQGTCDACAPCSDGQPGQTIGVTLSTLLGLNLGLDFGGDSECHEKPNYPSIMNLRYFLNGFDIDCDGVGDFVFDFSRGDRIPLNENSLTESVGVCGGHAPIDWNADGTIGAGVAANINPYAVSPPENEAAQCGGTHSVLRDYNDWDNLQFIRPAGGEYNTVTNSPPGPFVGIPAARSDPRRRAPHSPDSKAANGRSRPQRGTP